MAELYPVQFATYMYCEFCYSMSLEGLDVYIEQPRIPACLVCLYFSARDCLRCIFMVRHFSWLREVVLWYAYTILIIIGGLWSRYIDPSAKSFYVCVCVCINLGARSDMVACLCPSQIMQSKHYLRILLICSTSCLQYACIRSQKQKPPWFQTDGLCIM